MVKTEEGESMPYSDKYVLDTYKEVSVINEKHSVTLVQNIVSGKFFVKKVLSEYTREIYEWLCENPVSGMPKIIDIAEKDKSLYVIEEYIPGETLEEKIGREGVLSEKEAANIIVSLCDTVSCLHEINPPIIHRDIKSSNIILSDNMTVKLLDMNAARRYCEGENCDTRLIGTVGYAAPEQYGFMQSDIRTDIYSLGVLLNYMLTGKFPIEKKASGKLGKIVIKCTEMSPKDRYSSACEVKNEVMEAVGISSHQNSKIKNLKFLPPGFRSVNPFHMVTMAFVYYVIFVLSESMSIGNVKNVQISRIIVFTMFIFEVLLFGNWLGIQDNLPITKSENKWIKFLGCIIYAVIIFFVAVIFLMYI